MELILLALAATLLIVVLVLLTELRARRGYHCSNCDHEGLTNERRLAHRESERLAERQAMRDARH